MFRSFTIRKFEFPKYRSFYIWTFQILTPTQNRLGEIDIWFKMNDKIQENSVSK